MVATLKTGVIQEPSSSTANLTLDASGGVTVGQNLSVTGTTTFTGGSTFTGNATAAAFIPSGSTVPTNGLYLPAADSVGLATGSANALYINSSQNVGIGTTSPTQKLDVSGSINSSGTMVMASSFLRNRIINGDMRIDQRNAGAAVNANGGNATYPVDRFYSQVYNTTGNTTGQQSSIAPAGFTNSMKISVQTADTSVGATDQVWYGQAIEGYNIADLGFGAAGASSITLSFWVYSNVTGTYCVTFKNSAQNRGYTAEYTISASNTWEKKTITIAGDTTGTWLTTNGVGINIWFVLMAGSSQQTTANTWNSGSGTIATSNQVNFMSSTSNAWYITGVQLEVGSVATPFERRLYGQELALCQRYYEKSFDVNTAPASASASAGAFEFAQQVGASTTQNGPSCKYAVAKRAAATVTFYNWNAAGNQAVNISTAGNTTGLTLRSSQSGTTSYSITFTTPAGTSAGQGLSVMWTADAEL